MSLPKGTRLGPYELVTMIGEGGMGQVYRARDTRLDRTVAVKVLSARVVASADRRARFEREARLVSSLSHPHICALFDIGREGAIDFLVMEYLDGETLADRMAKGPLPLDLVLRFGSQIAAALDRAHRQGIVHRDLKPGNILVTASGVKLLDFGLAKLLVDPGADVAPAAVASRPTEAWPPPALTADGVILGTPQYMAPEQLEGRDADARVDLWAFGCVLYEMVTGRSSFSGASPASIVAAILGSEPERPSVRGVALPPALERLILACLLKDPDRRWQSALDAGLVLDGIAAGSAEQAGSMAARPRRRPWAWAAALVLLAGVAAGGVWLGRSYTAPPPHRAITFQVAPPPGTTFLAHSVEHVPVAISPDGQYFAFVAIDSEGSRIWQRRVDQLQARPIPGTEDARSLMWSPDGGSLAFFTRDKLRRIALGGGSAVTICDVTAGSGYSGSWGTDGTILFAGVQGQAIYRVPVTAGVPEKVVEADVSKQVFRVVWPRFLPDGRGFLYSSRTATGTSLMLVDDGMPPRKVADVATRVEFVGPDWLAFARDGALLAQRFDRAAARLTGAAVAIAPSIRVFFSSAWAGFAASPSGSVFYFSAQERNRLVWTSRSGVAEGTIGTPGDYLSVAIAPDGRSVLADRAEPELGTYDIWKIDLGRGLETRLTTSPEADFEPVWLPDGRALVYSTIQSRLNTGRAPNLTRRNLVTGEDEALLPRTSFQSATDISRDGRLLAFVERADSGKFHAWILELDGRRAARRLLTQDSQDDSVRFSPDGGYVAFISDLSGTNEVYVAPLANPGELVRISPHGAQALRWSHDGKEILFLGGDRVVMAVPVRTVPRLELGTPEKLFTLPEGVRWVAFDVTPDGRRLLAVVSESSAGAQPAAAIVGWSPDQAQ